MSVIEIIFVVVCTCLLMIGAIYVLYVCLPDADQVDEDEFSIAMKRWSDMLDRRRQ